MAGALVAGEQKEGCLTEPEPARVEAAIRFLATRREGTAPELAAHLGIRGAVGCRKAEGILRFLRWTERPDGTWLCWNAKRSWSESARDCVRLLDLMQEGGVWTRTRASKVLGVTKMQAMYTLRLLVKGGVVRRLGEYRNALYYATEPKPP